MIKVSGRRPTSITRWSVRAAPIPLSLSNSTFTVTFLQRPDDGELHAHGQRRHDGNTLEPITFDVVSVDERQQERNGRGRSGHHRCQRRHHGARRRQPVAILRVGQPGPLLQRDSDLRHRRQSARLHHRGQPDRQRAARLDRRQRRHEHDLGDPQSHELQPHRHQLHRGRRRPRESWRPTSTATATSTSPSPTSNGVTILLGNGHGAFTVQRDVCGRHRPRRHCRRRLQRRWQDGPGRRQRRLQQRLDPVRQRQRHLPGRPSISPSAPIRSTSRRPT